MLKWYFFIPGAQELSTAVISDAAYPQVFKFTTFGIIGVFLSLPYTYINIK